MGNFLDLGRNFVHLLSIAAEGRVAGRFRRPVPFPALRRTGAPALGRTRAGRGGGDVLPGLPPPEPPGRPSIMRGPTGPGTCLPAPAPACCRPAAAARKGWPWPWADGGRVPATGPFLLPPAGKRRRPGTAPPSPPQAGIPPQRPSRRGRHGGRDGRLRAPPPVRPHRRGGGAPTSSVAAECGFVAPPSRAAAGGDRMRAEQIRGNAS